MLHAYIRDDEETQKETNQLRQGRTEINAIVVFDVVTFLFLIL